MFTVLIRSRKDGQETLIEAQIVERRTQTANGDEAGLFLFGPKEINRQYAEAKEDRDLCDVFVMNEYGKTVARYVL